jgi:hypothetical protein
MRRPSCRLLFLLLACAAAGLSAQRDDKATLLQQIDARRENYATVAKQIWGFAEVGYREAKSSAHAHPEGPRGVRPEARTELRVQDAPCGPQTGARL